MVEEDAAASEEPVALAVVHRHPVGEELGDAVRAAGIEGRVFLLRNGLDVAEHLRRRGLVVPDAAVRQADRVEQVEGAQSVDVRGGFGLVEARAHVALRRQVVDLVGLRIANERDRTAQVRQVVLHEMKLRMVLDAERLDAPEVHRTGSAEGSVDGVSLAQQQLGQVRPVLSGNASDDSTFFHGFNEVRGREGTGQAGASTPRSAAGCRAACNASASRFSAAGQRP
ncbi:hypothetical protein D3C72_1574710 [compost metagenome]